MFFRKLKFGATQPPVDELNQLDSEIAKFESLIESAPQKLREQRERERTTMPAPDDFADRRRERRFYIELRSKGQVRNERRYRTRNTVLFVLLASATVSIFWWIYSELLRNGVIS